MALAARPCAAGSAGGEAAAGWAGHKAEARRGEALREQSRAAVLGLNLRRVPRAGRLLEGLDFGGDLRCKARAAARRGGRRDQDPEQPSLAFLAGILPVIPRRRSHAGRSRPRENMKQLQSGASGDRGHAEGLCIRVIHTVIHAVIHAALRLDV